MSHDTIVYIGGIALAVAPAPIIGLIARTPLQALVVSGITGCCLAIIWDVVMFL